MLDYKMFRHLQDVNCGGNTWCLIIFSFCYKACHMQTRFPKVHCEKVDRGKSQLLAHPMLFLAGKHKTLGGNSGGITIVFQDTGCVGSGTDL